MSCGRDRTVVLWNPAKGLRIKTYEGHGYEVRDLAISGDNTRFASVGGDKQVFHWDVGSGGLIRKFQGHDHRINAVQFAADDQVLVSGGEDKAVKVWDCRAHNTQALQVMQPFRDSVMSIAVPAGRQEVFAAGVDGTIRRFDIRMGQMVTDTVHHPVVCISLSADGNFVAAACLDSTVRLLDRDTGASTDFWRAGNALQPALTTALLLDGTQAACSTASAATRTAASRSPAAPRPRTRTSSVAPRMGGKPPPPRSGGPTCSTACSDPRSAR